MIPAPPAQAECTRFVNSSARNVQGCTIYVQAGVPYTGKLFEFNLCLDHAISNVQVTNIFSKPSSDSDPSHRQDILGDIKDLKWEQRDGYVNGTYKWDVAGDYNLVESVVATCNYNGGLTSYRIPGPPGNPSPGTTHVLAPQAPATLMFDPSKSYRRGKIYETFGTLGLESPAPKSGTMVRLKTNHPGVVDIKTSFGQTSKDAASTYAWISPDTQPPITTFGVIISNTARVGLRAVISADCVGVFTTTSDCQILTAHPKVMSFTVQAASAP
jgi:hypothetical protein